MPPVHIHQGFPNRVNNHDHKLFYKGFMTFPWDDIKTLINDMISNKTDYTDYVIDDDENNKLDYAYSKDKINQLLKVLADRITLNSDDINLIKEMLENSGNDVDDILAKIEEITNNVTEVTNKVSSIETRIDTLPDINTIIESAKTELKQYIDNSGNSLSSRIEVLENRINSIIDGGTDNTK